MSLNVLTQGGGTGGASASIFVTGLSEADTVTATKDGKTVKGKWTQKPNPAYVELPSGYTHLEYIQSSGTQHINTGIVPSSKTKVVAKIAALSASFTNGWSSSQSKEAFQWGTNSSSAFFFNVASVSTGVDISAMDSDVHTFDLESGSQKFDGESVGATTIGDTAESGQTMYLFRVHAEWNTSGLSGDGSGRYYECRIYESGNLVRDFVPAKRNSDSVVGMYDLANDVFYTNSGTGTFIAGAEIHPTIDGHNITIKDYGMWTVTATNGEQTETQDVLVDAAVEYEIKMRYKLWLYREGDECSNITGGWIEQSFYKNHSAFSLTKNNDNLQIDIAAASTSGTWYKKGFTTQNSIDLSGYSVLMVETLSISYAQENIGFMTAVASSLSDNNNSGNLQYHSAVVDLLAPNTIYEIDVSGITEVQYIVFYGAKGTSSKSASAQVCNIWLE